jgi:hypothetical protein
VQQSGTLEGLDLALEVVPVTYAQDGTQRMPTAGEDVRRKLVARARVVRKPPRTLHLDPKLGGNGYGFRYARDKKSLRSALKDDEIVAQDPPSIRRRRGHERRLASARPSEKQNGSIFPYESAAVNDEHVAIAEHVGDRRLEQAAERDPDRFPGTCGREAFMRRAGGDPTPVAQQERTALPPQNEIRVALVRLALGENMRFVAIDDLESGGTRVGWQVTEHGADRFGLVPVGRRDPDR